MIRRCISHIGKYPLLAYGSGAFFVLCSILLMVAHVRSITEVREVSVPIISRIPELERRVRLLREQADITEFAQSPRSSALQEQLDAYILPAHTDLGRLVGILETLRDALKKNGALAHMSAIDISDTVSFDEGILSQDVSVELALHEEGVRAVGQLVQLAGLLTVGDALGEESIALLLRRIEEENPSGLIAFEQFLSTDLLRYARDAKAYEEQLKRSFVTTAFLSTFEHVIETSLLQDAKELFRGDFGSAVERAKLWPAQFMMVSDIELVPGKAQDWYSLRLVVSTFIRES